MKKNEIIRYCAGAAFWLQVFLLFQYGFDLAVVPFAIGYATIGLSFFLKKPVLATAVEVVCLFLRVVGFLVLLFSGDIFWYIKSERFWVVHVILTIVSNILFIVLTVKRKKQLGYVAAATSGIECLVIIFLLHSFPSAKMILSIAGLALAGLAYENMPAKVRKVSLNVVHSSTADKIQHLEKLYDLLEKGILTQEEFDEKKKQLLNL